MVAASDDADEATVEAKIRELAERWSPNEILFDPHMGARLMSRLVDDGLPVAEVRQTRLIMSPMYQELQRAIIGRKLKHGGNPVLRHCIASAVPVYGDTGLVYLSERKLIEPIDAAVATGMALGRAAIDAGPVDDIYGRDDFTPESVWY